MEIITPQRVQETSFITRASTATYRNDAGVLATAPINFARPIFGSNNEWLGIYTEEAATQLFTEHLDFSDAYWTKLDATVTGSQADPSGGTDAYLITGTSTSARVSRAPIAAGTYTLSVFARAGTTSTLQLSDGTASAFFDFSNGSSLNGEMTAYANGWFRCSLTYTNAATHTAFIVTGDGTMTLYGANIATGNLSSYINGASRAAETRNVPTQASIVYNNVPLENIPQWTSGDYTQGTERIYENDIYRVSVATTNDRPDVGAAASPPTWVLRAPVNRLRMFDLTRSEDVSTTNDGNIDVVLYMPSFFNGIGLINTAGGETLIESLEPGQSEPGQSVSVPMVSTFGINNYYPWFFEQRVTISRFARTDVSGRSGTLLRIRMTPRGGTARIGKLVVGTAKDVGTTQTGVSVRTVDQSPNERNEFGDVVLRPGRVTTVANFTVSVPFQETDGITELAKSLASTNTVFIGEGGEGYGVTILYGYAQEYEATLATGPQALYRITVESI